MPWYPSSFAASTRDWPLVARAVYRELLDAQWDMGSVPADPAQLQMMIRCTPAEWKKAWPLVRQKFVVCEDGRLRNRKLEEHREKALQIRDKRSGAAKKRWSGKVVPLRGDHD